jgi:hypothetical protein
MDLECLNLIDLVKIIAVYEITSFMFVTTSSLVLSYCMTYDGFRKFMKINRK